jgi:hypothetical protein
MGVDNKTDWPTDRRSSRDFDFEENQSFFSKYTTHNHPFAAALLRFDQQHPQPPSQQKQQQSSGKNTHQDTNQASGQSVQAKNVNTQQCNGHVPCLHYGAEACDSVLWCCDNKIKGCYRN